MSLWRLGDNDVVSQCMPSGVSHGRAGRAIRITKISLYPGIFFSERIGSRHQSVSIWSQACSVLLVWGEG